MLKYYTWALAEKALSYVPLGSKVYAGVGALANRKTKGTLPTFATSLPLARKAKELVPPGGSVIDIGTGWFHHDAFLLHLVGRYQVYLFDVVDKARLHYIRNYLGNLLKNLEQLTRELEIDAVATRAKLEGLLRLESRAEIYQICNFTPCIVPDPTTPFLPDDSVDFMVSNCVLNHIRPAQLQSELVALRRMLKPDGAMYHLLGHDDHWSFHDSAANRFNYYRYSDRYYRLFFETKLEYNNRMVKQEWFELFDRVGLRIDDYYANITDESRRDIAMLPRIDTRFAKHPAEDLAVIHSYVLVRKRPDGGPEARRSGIGSAANASAGGGRR